MSGAFSVSRLHEFGTRKNARKNRTVAPCEFRAKCNSATILCFEPGSDCSVASSKKFSPLLVPRGRRKWRRGESNRIQAIKNLKQHERLLRIALISLGSRSRPVPPSPAVSRSKPRPHGTLTAHESRVFDPPPHCRPIAVTQHRRAGAWRDRVWQGHCGKPMRRSRSWKRGSECRGWNIGFTFRKKNIGSCSS